MTANYISICGRYGPLPMLVNMTVLAFCSALAGFYWLIVFYFCGLVGASWSENYVARYLSRKHFGIRRGSFILHGAQLMCVLLGVCAGLAAEYQLANTQHNIHVLNGRAGSAFAQIVEHSR